MLQAGTILGNRYEIIELVGTGGMAHVYKAKCHRLNRYVAIKVLKEEFEKDDDFVKRFHVEAQSAAGLIHPNIVNIYDVGEEAGLHYIVMELVEGVTLQEYIKNNKKLNAQQAVNLSIQIAQGIEAAHNNNTVHRDIKPQNIIITNDGRAKVTDFGIARASNVNTITMATIGSVHYFSPEQARGGYVDTRSDIYSLGITMFEMVTGHVPFDGDNAVTVALKHLQDEVVFTEEESADIPRSLEKIILKAVNKKPEFRYDTITSMIQDLKSVFDSPDGAYVSSKKQSIAVGKTIVMPKEDVEKIKAARGGGAVSNGDKGKKAEKKQEEEIFHSGEEMDPKLEKIIMALTVVVGIIFAVIFISFIASKLGAFGGSKNTEHTADYQQETTTASQATTEAVKNPVLVPQVTGKHMDDAMAEVEALNLIPKIETEVSNDVEKDYVIRQSLVRGSEVEEGTEIILVVSEGKDSVDVPDTVGQKETKAKEMLMEKGFRVSTEEDYSDKYKEGLVMAQTPDGKSKAEYGSKITLTISKGPEKISVISVIGRTKEVAKELLEDNRLQLGKVTEAYSDSYEAGTIISQDPVKNTQVKAGTKVNVVISKGSSAANVSYEGKVSIACPFEEGVESGTVKLVLSQSNHVKTIYEGTLSRGDFPFSLAFEGYVEGTGIVTVYVDGNEIDSYSVDMKKVNR